MKREMTQLGRCFVLADQQPTWSRQNRCPPDGHFVGGSENGQKRQKKKKTKNKKNKNKKKKQDKIGSTVSPAPWRPLEPSRIEGEVNLIPSGAKVGSRKR